MATTAHPALARFLEARSDRSERASAHAGLEACYALSDLLDEALRELADESPSSTIVAVGGYGRRVQSRHSDVDVMLLIDGVEEGAVRALYPLWDANLKVGHSVRTVAQAMVAADANLETFTALLDARFVAGDQALYGQLIRARARLVRSHRGWMRSEITERRVALRNKEPWQLLAADLKNGRGGLRDFHALHWMDAAEAIANGEDTPLLSPALEAAHEHLLRTRNAVHALADRPTDVYRPDQANLIGHWLGVDPLDWGRGLYASMRLVDAAIEGRLARSRRAGTWPARFRLPWRWGGAPAPVSDSAGGAAGGPASASGDGSPHEDLERLRAALRIAASGGSLDPLPLTSTLDRLLPEWEVLRARAHIAPFHIHPVDVHVMRAVAEARQVMAIDQYDSDTTRVAREFGDPDEVLLAALLHDIGKGHGGDHSDVGAVITERFVARAGLPADLGLRLIAAVRMHLLLPNVATRRDIADPAVIEETARRIGDARTLRLLYLLSVADARASGPNVWSQWKAQLMRAFYVRLMAVLASEAPDAAAPTIERVAEALRDRFPEPIVRAHLAGMGADYLLSTPADLVGDHLALIAQAAANGGTAARLDRLGTLDRLTVVTPDRPGLIQTVAGTLAGYNASVLGGVAHTHDDGVAIEVWHVSDALGVGIDDRRWERILQAVPAALAGEFSIEERLAEVRSSYPAPPLADVPTVVHIDNAASRDYTILEVSTADRRGLLYGVTRLLHDSGIDIHLAKVDTIGPEVVDAFYIRRANGRRIDGPDEMARLRRAVIDVLEALDP